MKITIQVPDSVLKKKNFSKDRFRQEAQSLLFLRLYQEGYISFEEAFREISVSENVVEPKQVKKAGFSGTEFLKLSGIWKNRPEMENSVDYVQEMRKKISYREL